MKDAEVSISISCEHYNASISASRFPCLKHWKIPINMTLFFTYFNQRLASTEPISHAITSL